MAEMLFIKASGGSLIPADDSVRETMKAWKIGDTIKVNATKDRNGKHHRKGRVLLETLFENQDHFKHIEVYHHWVKMQIGLFDIETGPDGKIFPIVKSTKYSEMGQEEYNAYYQALITFAIQDGSILEGKTPEQADAFVDMILGGFA